MFIETILKILKEFKVNKSSSWKSIPKKVKDFLLYGENYGLKKEIAHTIKTFFAKDDEKVEKISFGMSM